MKTTKRKELWNLKPGFLNFKVFKLKNKTKKKHEFIILKKKSVYGWFGEL